MPHRRFLPVTDDVIRWHLSGRDDAGQPFVAGVYPLLRDETCFLVAVDFDKGGWREDAAADAMLAHDTGVLAATTAFGKTVVAAWLIAQRGVNALMLVHRQQLLDQWVDRLSAFLGIPAKSIGRIGGGRNRPTGQLDVALIQSLVRKGVVDDRVADYAHVIVDECHHVSAHSFEQVARQAKARFVVGLSATVARKDGHHPIIFMQCGPVRHRVNARAQAAARPFEHLVLVQPTTFQPVRAPEIDRRVEFQALYRDLVVDERRNRGICDAVVASVNCGRSPLVLTERNDHVDRFPGDPDGHVASGGYVYLEGDLSDPGLPGLLDPLQLVAWPPQVSRRSDACPHRPIARCSS